MAPNPTAWSRAAGLAVLLALAAHPVRAQLQASQPVMAAAFDPAPPLRAPACADLIPRPWPVGLLERRLHLQRLSAALDNCIANPPFLAALGALWLEDGDPEQARTWLERSLMLDAEQPGAQADHAFALAALGEPTALRELALAWRNRADLPEVLRQRVLAALDPAADTRLPLVRLGGGPLAGRSQPSSGSRGDAAVLLGYDNNLGHAPRLTELTLTAPEGPIVLPVSSQPRYGPAARAELSWQTAWASAAGRVLRAGLSASARHARGNADTDWHQIQAAGGYTQQWNGWSATAQADATWFGGRLTEPYALLRTRFGVERQGENCGHALQVEAALRRQSQTRSADSLTSLLGWRSHCRPFGLRDWTLVLGLHAVVDQSRQDGRPGGTQHGEGWLLRAEHRPTVLHRIDVSIGGLRLRDSEGYSPLIDDNAMRRQRQIYVSVELGYALNLQWMPGAEAVFQFTQYRQGSNLVLFRRDGVSAYSGLRWLW